MSLGLKGLNIIILINISQNQSLKDQNLILKKNISSLYLTAREEIQRKDAQIKSLQQKEVKKKFRRVQSSKEN